MSRTNPRPALTRQRFDAALDAAGIKVSAHDRDAIFETAAWLDAGLATLESNRDKAPVK